MTLERQLDCKKYGNMKEEIKNFYRATCRPNNRNQTADESSLCIPFQAKVETVSLRNTGKEKEKNS